MNILIVEDEHDLGKTISDYLKISGYVCEWVDNFEKGMEKTWVYTCPPFYQKFYHRKMLVLAA